MYVSLVVIWLFGVLGVFSVMKSYSYYSMSLAFSSFLVLMSLMLYMNKQDVQDDIGSFNTSYFNFNGKKMKSEEELES
jgi:hypothetical protein